MSTDLDRELANFGNRLRESREIAGLTQAAGCAAIGASPTQWSNWERGKGRPFLEDLAKVARLLGVSVHWLLLGEGPRTIEQLRLASASTPNASAAALVEALRSMPAADLERLARERRDQEQAAWNEPIRRAIESMQEALGANPPLPVRDEINRAIERMRRDLEQGPPAGEGENPALRYRTGPKQRDGYTEEVEVEYGHGQAEPDAEPPRSGRKRKETGS